MTPTQFKQARHELRLSTNQLGRIMNTNARTIRRWESGERQPNPVAVRILEWLLAGFRPKEWPGGKKATALEARKSAKVQQEEIEAALRRARKEWERHNH